MPLTYRFCCSLYENIHYAICYVIHKLLSVRLMASLAVPVLKRGMRILIFRITLVHRIPPQFSYSPDTQSGI
jgi:hypothetical protein